MISTRLYELVHRFRSQGQMNDALPLSCADYDQLRAELRSMHCVRALHALNQAVPKFCGLALAIEGD